MKTRSMTPEEAQRAAAGLTCSGPCLDDTSDKHEQSGDWPDGQYACEFRAESGQSSAWTARHELSGAPGVQALLDSGEAEWAVETRCALALHVSLSTSRNASHTVKVDPAVVGHYSDIRLWPGVVVTAERCRLDPSGTAWGDWGGEPIEVARGRWLVRGAPVKASHDKRSLLQFVSQDMTPKHKVLCKVQDAEGDYFIQIHAHPDRIEQLQTGEALLGCWAAALALLPLHDYFEIVDGEDGPSVPASQNANAVLQRLEAENVPLWGPDDQQKIDWDPWEAATVFLPLELRQQPTPDADDADDDD